MQIFQDTFETCNQSFFSAFSISITVPLIFFLQDRKRSFQTFGTAWRIDP